MSLFQTFFSNERTLAKEAIHYNQCKISFSNKYANYIFLCAVDIILDTISITKNNVLTMRLLLFSEKQALFYTVFV